eukprot:10585741-Lingulodinium_polyedra.AAC.1
MAGLVATSRLDSLDRGVHLVLYGGPTEERRLPRDLRRGREESAARATRGSFQGVGSLGHVGRPGRPRA